MKTYDSYTVYPELWGRAIPSYWDILPMYAVAREKNVCDCVDLPLLSVYLDVGVIPFFKREEKRTNATSKDLSKYQRVDLSDFVLNNQQAWRGSVGVSFYTGIVSPAYIVLSMSDRLNSKYANYLFRSRVMVDQYLIHSKSVGSIQRNIYWPALKRIRVIIPPRTEQDQIVRFLDWKVSEINKLINIKHQEIDVLKELKQRKLSYIITHGLNPDVTMKETGIGWVGNIPSHWKCVPLKRCAKVRSGITLGKKYPNGTHLIDVPYLRVANVQNGHVILDTVVKIKITPDEAQQYQLPKGCVLMTEGGDRDKLGRGCVWNGEIENCVHQNHIFAVTVNDELIQNKWLEYVSASDVGRIYFDLTAIKTTNLACTNASKVMAFPIPLPPREEQEIISAELQKILAEFDNIHNVLERKIELLSELKARIIADAVTGKINVCNVAIPDYEYIEENIDETAVDNTDDMEGEADE